MYEITQCIVCGKRRGRWPITRRFQPQCKCCSEKCYRKSAKQNARAGIPRSVYESVMQEYNGACAYCGDTASEIDHIIPYSKGGANDKSNLAAACFRCNHTAMDRKFKSFDEKKAWILSTRATKEKEVLHNSRGDLNKVFFFMLFGTELEKFEARRLLRGKRIEEFSDFDPREKVFVTKYGKRRFIARDKGRLI